MSKADDLRLFPHSHADPTTHLHHLTCNFCGERCSSAFMPIPTEIGRELVVRAIVTCPECIDRQYAEALADAK